MATGTSKYQPTAAEIIASAFARLEIRRTQLTHTHMIDARQEMNLMQVSWGNQGPNLWTVENSTISLVAGQAVYDVDPTTIEILDAYVTPNLAAQTYDAGPDANTDANVVGMPGADGSAVIDTNNRIVTGIDRTDYVSLVNKFTPGMPSTFWHRKGIEQKIYFWPVPDQAMLFSYWRTRHLYDAALDSADMGDIPYLWYDAAVAGLAHRLARIYKPAIEAQRSADFDRAYAIAAAQDQEYVPWTLTPDVSGYYD